MTAPLVAEERECATCGARWKLGHDVPTCSDGGICHTAETHRAAAGDDHSNEPWCPEHGYGCEPQDCPCGHSLRCDCWSIRDEH